MIQVGFAQYAVVKDRDANIKTVSMLLKRMNSDIIVLPELADCGYFFDDKGQLRASSCTLQDNPFIDALSDLSAHKKCAIIAGIAECADEKIFNAAVILENGTLRGVYRKIHLTDLEKKLFDSGTENRIFSVHGLKIGVQICFDLWFPEISREQIMQGAQILCALANFGGESTPDIARVRAMENMTPLIMCNRVGEEQSTVMERFLGRSTIIDPSGTRLAIGADHAENVRECALQIPESKSNVMCSDLITEMRFHYPQKRIVF